MNEREGSCDWGCMQATQACAIEAVNSPSCSSTATQGSSRKILRSLECHPRGYQRSHLVPLPCADIGARRAPPATAWLCVGEPRDASYGHSVQHCHQINIQVLTSTTAMVWCAWPPSRERRPARNTAAKVPGRFKQGSQTHALVNHTPVLPSVQLGVKMGVHSKHVFQCEPHKRSMRRIGQEIESLGFGQ